MEEYSSSVHGQAVMNDGNLKAAVCIDCHTSHNITKTNRDPYKFSVTKQCGGCHIENRESYGSSYHGKIHKLGYTHTAKCYDCHDSHEIYSPKNSDSLVHKDNVLETCQECHNGKKLPLATEGFVSFSPHANAHDLERYPQVWYTTIFMEGLLIFVFAYFWLHSLWWWYREYKSRNRGEERPHVKLDALPDIEHMHVRRFGFMWRLAHLFFALSIMILILTGMAVHYSDTAWASFVINALGGPKLSGLIHRVCAITMLSIFVIHLGVVIVNIFRSRKTFRWFGPESLVPNWKDLSDAWAMFKWFANKGPRPVFDRWTYWEKFDYWAVFWGMAIIGSSGVILMYPTVVATYMPGWVINVATVVHGEEAFLAAVFLFTVHFFNNNFTDACADDCRVNKAFCNSLTYHTVFKVFR